MFGAMVVKATMIGVAIPSWLGASWFIPTIMLVAFVLLVLGVRLMVEPGADPTPIHRVVMAVIGTMFLLAGLTSVIPRSWLEWLTKPLLSAGSILVVEWAEFTNKQYGKDAPLLIAIGIVTIAGVFISYRRRNAAAGKQSARQLTFFPIMMLAATLLISGGDEMRRILSDAILVYMLTEQARDTWNLLVDDDQDGTAAAGDGRANDVAGMKDVLAEPANDKGTTDKGADPLSPVRRRYRPASPVKVRRADSNTPSE